MRNVWRDCHWYFGDRGNLHAGSDDDNQINEFYIVFLKSIKEFWRQTLAEKNYVRLAQVSFQSVASLVMTDLHNPRLGKVVCPAVITFFLAAFTSF